MKLTKTLYRFDINQSVQNLNCKYVDFIINDTVYRVQVENGNCKIPDEFLQNAGNQKFYECFSDGTRSEHLVTVHDRPQPPDYVYTPTERETFDSLVEKINIKLEEVPEYINDYFTEHKDEFKGNKGDKGEKGDPATPGKDGYTPIKGVDYFDGAKGEKGDRGEQGLKGDPGEDYVLTNEDLQKISTLVAVPTKISELQNDSGYITTDDVPPEIYVGSEEPQGNEVIWVDDSTTAENIVATKAYVDEIVNLTNTRIVTDTENTVIPAFELAYNTEYRFTLELQSVEFTLPDNPKDDYISSIVFKSGATATTITYPDTIKWTGDDISSDKFVPASSKTYEVLIYWNGFDYCGIVKGW